MDPMSLELCEELDAMLFTGDSLHSKEAIEEFESYLERWKNRVVEIRELVEEMEALDE